MSAWTEHVAKWRDCVDCPLAMQRGRICLARGSVPADVLFIGEAPGQSEDAIGQPFKGPAGQLLDEMILRAIPDGITHALTNLVACFPRDAKDRGENEPEHDEILACRQRLVEFVRVSRPRLIVLVGALAKRYVSGAAMFRLDGAGCQPEWVPDGTVLEFVEIVHPAHIKRKDVPLAKKQSMITHAVVTLRAAVDDMIESIEKYPRVNWTPTIGEKTRAHVKPKRRQGLRELFNDLDGWPEAPVNILPDDDIPF